MALIDRARHTIDLQYYIWKSDTAGQLLESRLLAAADRGVKVRLLLDDVGITPADSYLRTLDAHPNVEVRLFNPLTLRSLPKLGFLLEFNRLNRRMHNKSLTVDGQLTVIGGRNIADEYFEAREDMDHDDLDVMVVGPPVPEVAHSFQLYWTSPAATPVDRLPRWMSNDRSLTQLRDQLRQHEKSMTGSRYYLGLQSNPFRDWPATPVRLLWGQARVYYDDPDKARIGKSATATHLLPQMLPLAAATQEELMVVSAYFIPGKDGMRYFKSLRERGVRVLVFTNSLSSTEVPWVHSGYAKYRKPLLRMGVELYEARPNASLVSRSPEGARAAGLRDSSGASLHAKTFVADRKRAFIGSLNLDPRSLVWNTEIGMVFENQELGSRMAEVIDQHVKEDAYQLVLEGNRLVWLAREHGQIVRYSKEPATTWGKRMKIRTVALLPIESQL
ncbi:MAG: phospholipase D family protein [Verrucomicrobium sp.]